MSFLLWHARDAGTRDRVGVASPRLVFKAAEVPLLRDAEQLVAHLNREAEEQAQALAAAREQAKRAGFEEGRREGLRDSQAAVAQSLQQMSAQVEAERDAMRAQVAALAVAATRKLLGDWQPAERLAAAARQAAQAVLPHERIRLHVHPTQVEAVSAALSEFGRGLPGHTEIVGDPLIDEDECRLETALGSAEVGLPTQLARLAAAWGVAPGGEVLP